MDNLKHILNDNKKIKKEIAKYSFGSNPSVDDAIIKGGYRVVRTIKERNSIDCCHRKLGMRVMVIGQDYSYKDYVLKGDVSCSNEHWHLVDNETDVGTINDSDVVLLDNYNDLDITKDIVTQQDLNKVLADILTSILNNQTVGDKTFIHDQFTPATVWNITHNLGKKPSVSVVDTAGTEVEGMVDYLGSTSQLKITFNYPFSGYATLN